MQVTEVHSGFETQKRHHQKSKTELSVAPHKKTYVLQKKIHYQIHTRDLGYYGIRLTSGRYPSYWNAFLFSISYKMITLYNKSGLSDKRCSSAMNTLRPYMWDTVRQALRGWRLYIKHQCFVLYTKNSKIHCLMVLEAIPKQFSVLLWLNDGKKA